MSQKSNNFRSIWRIANELLLTSIHIMRDEIIELRSQIGKTMLKTTYKVLKDIFHSRL